MTTRFMMGLIPLALQMSLAGIFIYLDGFGVHFVAINTEKCLSRPNVQPVMRILPSNPKRSS